MDSSEAPIPTVENKCEKANKCEKCLAEELRKKRHARVLATLVKK